MSPVKNSVKGLDSIISEIEDEQMREVIYPLYRLLGTGI